MMRQRSNLRGDCLTPTDLRLLGNPLDFIAEDHLHERAIYAEMDALALAFDPEQALMILGFLRNELPHLLADEDEGLFPLMLQRCPPEDEIGKTITRLEADHGRAQTELPKVIDAINAAMDAQTLPDGRVLTSFASNRRRHLIVENAIILPIARLRLKPSDLDVMRLSMLKRRQLDHVTETDEC